jgi:fumarate reductase flavoprotein subunit/NADH-quinone oxidoreductase subunit F
MGRLFRTGDRRKMIKDHQVIMEKLSSCGIKDYGVYKRSLADQWLNLEVETVIAGLNNSDSHGVLLKLLENEENIDKLFEGFHIASALLKAKNKLLFLPSEAKELAGRLENKAMTNGVKMMFGLIHERDWGECEVCHIVTMIELVNCLRGNYQEGIYISVNNGPLEKVEPQKILSDILTDKSIKGVILGYDLFGPEALMMTAEQAKINNGVVTTFHEQTCMIQEVEGLLLNSRERSCGRCVFCREGLLQLQFMHKDIKNGKGKPEYPDIAKEISEAMLSGCACSLGQEISKIVLGAISSFSTEYSNHIKRKKCEAGQCFSASLYYIDPELCEGCGDCLDVCPAGCIEGKDKYIHMIDITDCTACGACLNICEYHAIIKTDRKPPKLPIRLIKSGKFKGDRR